MTQPYISPDAMEVIKKRKGDLALSKANELLRKAPDGERKRWAEGVRDYVKEGKGDLSPSDDGSLKRDTGDLYKPGGKKFTKIAERLEALIKAGGATKEQIKQYEKLTGKKAPKSEID